MNNSLYTTQKSNKTNSVQCNRKSQGGCPICKQLIFLCCYHVKICEDSNCPVFFCPNIKAKLKASREVLKIKVNPNSLENIEIYKMQEEREMCFNCQDFKLQVGHETKWCPSIICKKCCQSGHAQIGCMFEMENLPMPDEILLKILGYLNLRDLIECSKVSKRLKGICFDKKLSYHTYHSAISGLCFRDKKIIMNALKDKPSILETEVFMKPTERKRKRKPGLLSYEIRDNKIILEVLPSQPKRSRVNLRVDESNIISDSKRRR